MKHLTIAVAATAFASGAWAQAPAVPEIKTTRDYIAACRAPAHDGVRGECNFLANIWVTAGIMGKAGLPKVCPPDAGVSSEENHRAIVLPMVRWLEQRPDLADASYVAGLKAAQVALWRCPG